MKRYISFFLALLTLSFLPATISVHAAIPTLPGLSISGTDIVANGKPVRLRGVNMGDPFWARNPVWYPNYSLADYSTLSQAWRANVVRISIFPTQWKNMDHTTLFAGLSQQINAALDNGMYVIISYHVIGWPDGYYAPANAGNPADTYDSSMSVATSFWSAIAQIYGSDARIIFDLWNEPVHPDDFTLYGSDPNPLWPTLKGYYESLIQTVRNNGGQNIVIATGNRWASWLVGIKDNPLTDSNVIYAYHKYSVNGLNTPTEWDKDTGGLVGIKPVIVSEWGYEDTDAGANLTWPGSQASYGDPFTQWLESHNLSNLAWMYHHDWTPALLKSDGSLTLYGAFVKNYISSHISLNANATIISGCSIFPSNNIWNTPIDNLPVDSHSSAWVNSIGSGTGLHMDFGSGTWNGGPIGIPFNISDNTTPKYTVSFLYSTESDPGPYPIPASPSIEYGSDHHLLVLDQSTCKLYETWDTSQIAPSIWSAGSGAIWDLSSNVLRPTGWTSADAAGLPILPGLVRYDEMDSGQINHAIRFTANSTNSFIWPARHLTSGTPGVLTSTPPMGARFRLKASFDISGYPAQVQVILQAMKTYGIILADNGSDWYISGVPDSRWNNTMLHLMDNITGNNFEAVNSSSLMVNPDSGATSITMLNGNAGVAGVTLTYTDGTPQFVTADGSGNYSISVPAGWSGTVTPHKIGYSFTPVSKTYSNVLSNQAGQNYTVLACATCADTDTTGVFRPSNGLLYLKNLNITGFADVAINYGLGGDYPVAGDWDGNGTATIGIYRNGSFYLRNSNTLGFADLVFAFGTPGDQPVAGDWNGDGIDTIGVYSPSTGQFLLRNSNASGLADMSFYLGNVGDVGIAGDWNGDGIDTTGVFRPSNGVIFLKNANTTGFADIALNYGLSGDQPVTGDWNNDGIDTIGVYRNATFYLRNSNTIGFADLVFALGNPGDMPIAGNWDNLP